MDDQQELIASQIASQAEKLNLEDIMREFGDEPEALPDPEDIIREFSPEAHTPAEEPVPEGPSKAEKKSAKKEEAQQKQEQKQKLKQEQKQKREQEREEKQKLNQEQKLDRKQKREEKKAKKHPRKAQDAAADEQEAREKPEKKSSSKAEKNSSPQTEKKPEIKSEPQPEPRQEESSPDPQATRRLPQVKQSKQPLAQGDTIPLPRTDDKTRKLEFIPVAEPDGEQEEYVPYKPIHFQPKDRLRSLKRKLVAGPEKRYYELSEIGVGKLQVAILLSLLVFFAAAVVTAVDALGYVAENRLRLMVFIQFFGMLLAATLGCYQLMEGIGDLFRGRFSMNTMLFLTFCVCIADGVFCFRQERVPCCAAFSLQVTMSLWGTYHRRVLEMGQMDTLRKASRIYGIFCATDYLDGQKGLLRDEGDVDDFTQNYQAVTGAERAFSWYGFFAVLASGGIGAAGAVLQNDVSFGVQVAAAAMLAAVPVTAFITLSRPGAILGKRLHSIGGVICGWQGMKGMSGKAVFALNHEDLFPVGTCKLNGVKFFSDRQSDQVIAYAQALVSEVGGAMVPLFDHLLQTHGGTAYRAENLRTYPNGGVGGEVNEESVLVGTLKFLKEMGVDIPEGVRVNHAVYIAIDGELCGLVAVTYAKHRDSAAGIGTLCADRGLTPVMTTGDFMITPEFIRTKFNVNPRRMLFPERQIRKELEGRRPDRDMPALAITTRDNFAAYAYCVTGARSLKTAQTLGLVVHIVAGLVGLGMMAALAILGTRGLLTPANMLLYQLVWLIPGFLLTEWTRHG